MAVAVLVTGCWSGGGLGGRAAATSSRRNKWPFSKVEGTVDDSYCSAVWCGLTVAKTYGISMFQNCNAIS